MWILHVGKLVKIGRWKYLLCEDIMKSWWSSFCLCLLDWDVLMHLQPQQVPYLHVITWDDSVTIVSSISVYSYDFTKSRMWLQMQHFMWLTERVGISQVTAGLLTELCLSLSFSPHLGEHLLQVSYLLSGIFSLSAIDYIFVLSLLFISLLQIVEGKSENLASWGELLCPTKISDLLSQDMMNMIHGFVTSKAH